MKSPLTVNVLKKQIAPILKSFGILRAGLFGSAARGELKKKSDIDILIDTGGKLGLFDVVKIKLALEKKLQRDIDLVEYRAIKPSLRKRILIDHLPIV